MSDDKRPPLFIFVSRKKGAALMIRVGVTGGIGSGKSTVSRILEAKGAYVFDADNVAKNLLDSDSCLQQELINEFMDDIIDSNGHIQKEKLAQIGFSSQENQEMLNAIIHPYVFRANDLQQEKLARQGVVPLYVLDAPLLFESGLDRHVDYTILVYARFKIRLERALRRGTLSREEILRRMDLQMPEEEKMQLADFIIENNGTEQELHLATEQVYRRIVG